MKCDILMTTDTLMRNSSSESMRSLKYPHALSDSAFVNFHDEQNMSHVAQLSMYPRNSSVSLILSSMSIFAVAITRPLRTSSSKLTGTSSR